MVTPTTHAPARPPADAGTMLEVVRTHADELKRAFGHLGGRNLAVFGSVARRAERPDSDVDLLIDAEPDVGLFALLRMQGIAQDLLGRSVDVVPRSGLKAELTEHIAADAIDL